MDRKGHWICSTIALSTAIAASGCMDGKVQLGGGETSGGGSDSQQSSSSASSSGSSSSGTTSPSGPVVSAGDFRTLSAGAEHTCGLRADGKILCWGYSTYGQLDAPSGAFVDKSLLCPPGRRRDRLLGRRFLRAAGAASVTLTDLCSARACSIARREAGDGSSERQWRGRATPQSSPDVPRNGLTRSKEGRFLPTPRSRRAYARLHSLLGLLRGVSFRAEASRAQGVGSGRRARGSADVWPGGPYPEMVAT
jgi:hypothetical protein